MFPKYYDSEHFSADKMHARATMSITNKDYQPPSDIQLYYILEIINNLSVIGQTHFKIFRSQIDDSVLNKLRELGYFINKSNSDSSLIIHWNKEGE